MARHAMAHLSTRRTAIARLGLAVPGLWAGARLGVVPRRAADDLEALAQRIRAVPRESILDLAAEAIAAGATRETMLGAVFLAGVQDIRPRPHGILHCVMMVGSAFQLSDASVGSARTAWHPVLFNLDDFKASQARDVREADDYRMQPLPAAKPVTADAARREFIAAMHAWDAERAERAVVALIPQVDHDTFFELLWPLAARCFAFLGHKAIYAVQVERVLRRIGWQYAEPALRSLVLALLVERQTNAFAGALELAESLATDPAKDDDPARVEDLLQTLRSASPDDARLAVIAALRAGTGASAVWDAVVLLGSEVFWRRPGRRSADGRNALLPVHALTVPSALRDAFLAARGTQTQRLLLLQATHWTVALRDGLSSMVGLSMQGEPLVAAAGNAPASVDEALAEGSPAAVLGCLTRQPAHADAILARLRASLASGGREHHQHKYAAAMQTEAARVHPRFRPLLIAPAVDYLAHAKDQPTDVHARAEAALGKAGVG